MFNLEFQVLVELPVTLREVGTYLPTYCSSLNEEGASKLGLPLIGLHLRGRRIGPTDPPQPLPGPPKFKFKPPWQWHPGRR